MIGNIEEISISIPCEKDSLKMLILSHQNIYIETQFTTHHIYKLLKPFSDSGCFAWDVYFRYGKVPSGKESEIECLRSRVYNFDGFPRWFFSVDNLVDEVSIFLNKRDLKIVDIRARNENE